MPHLSWRHVCKHGEVVQGSPECAACGNTGHFNGWLLSMWEAMAVYGYVYGLNPIGPHRPFADRLFAEMRDRCVRCGGRTVLTVGDGSRWSRCPTCEGTGGVWNRPVEEVEAARQQVVARWPSAAMEERPRPRPRRAVARTEARPRPKGYSSHGLRFSDVERAFAEAERLLGTNWQLKGRGHCCRASLDPRYANHALRGAARSWGLVRPHHTLGWKRLLPLAIIEKAAEVLGVPARLLMSREF